MIPVNLYTDGPMEVVSSPALVFLVSTFVDESVVILDGTECIGGFCVFLQRYHPMVDSIRPHEPPYTLPLSRLHDVVRLAYSFISYAHRTGIVSTVTRQLNLHGRSTKPTLFHIPPALY